MSKWKNLFGASLKVIGMLHIPALPGTPLGVSSVQRIVQHVLKEVDIYMRTEIDALLLENMHDVPYVQPIQMGPEVTSVMTRVCSEVRRVVPSSVPCGVQVLACGNKEALATALAAELQFIRCEGFVFGHIADEGWTNSCAAELLRYRKAIAADNILVVTDIKKKHSSHAMTSDVDIVETASAAQFFLSDGLVLTGSGTGKPANASELKRVVENASLPVIIGSGITKENMEKFALANAFIVGSHFKKGGRWDQELLEEKVRSFMGAAKLVKKNSSRAAETCV